VNPPDTGATSCRLRNSGHGAPTLSICAAGHDVVRAQNLPWYRDYVHPAMEEHWKPDVEHYVTTLMEDVKDTVEAAREERVKKQRPELRFTQPSRRGAEWREP
jgi:hypothetical protein